MYDFDDDDVCYECSAYGDDYFTNEDGKLECRCTTCEFMGMSMDYDGEDD